MTDNIRLNLDQAYGENPDQYARDREIGRGLGMPPRLLNDSDRSIYRAIQSDTALQGLPVTRRFYGNYDNAVLAQDDSENLGKIEHRLRLRQVREWGEEHRIRSNEPGFMSGALGEAWGNVRKIPTAMAANSYDSWAESWRRRIQREEAAGTLTPEKRQQYEAFARQYDTRLGAEQEEIKSINAGIRENAPRNLALWQKMVRGAFTSSPYSLGALAVSIATGNPFAGPLAMGYAVGETGRAEARMDGLSYEDAWRKGAIDGVAEAVFEWLPMRHMLKLYVGNSATRQAARTALQEEARAAARMSRKEVLQTFGKAARSDALGENATQLIQDLNNLYYGLDPELQKAIDEHGLFSAEVLKIQGERQLVATGSSVITSVALGGPRLIADMKQRHNDGLDNLDATAEAVRNSRTRERAPDVFDQYVRDLVEDSDLGDIYADGNALHQDGLDVALAEALPERADDIRAAVENGGAVQIPLEDYLSRIAPNDDLTNALRPHIRDADGMSAQELDNNALGELEQDIRNEVTRLATEDTRAAEIQALEQSIIEQLNTAGQTITEANRTYATLYTANVDVFSRQMGLSPQEYHAQYGIHIAGGNIVVRTQEGEQVLTPAEAARRLAAGAEAAVQGGQNAGTAAQGAPAASTAAAQQNGQPLSTAEVLRRWAAGEEKALVDSLRKQVGELGTTAFDARIDALEAQYNSAEADALPLEIHAYARENGYTAQRTGNGIGQFEWVQQNTQASAQNSYQQLDETADSAFAQAIERVVSGENITGFVPMGTTPEALQLAGLPDVRVSIRGNVIKKVMSEWLGGGHGHNLNPDTLKRLPMELNRPVAVARSAQDSSNRDAYIVLTELTETDIYDGKEKPVIAALMVNVTNGGLEVVNITSVYGRSKAQIQRSLNTDLLYWDKEKGKQFVNAFRLQLPSHLRTDAALAKANIKTNEDLTQGADPQQEFAETAKQYGGEAAYEQAKAAGETELDYRQWVQVRTPSFKAWFGDWENDPENASKVVNPRTGEPQVVYHGTNAQFDTFDWEKAGAGNDKGMRGKGIYLSPNERTADSYGETIMPAFVSLKNPFDPFVFSSKEELVEHLGMDESTFSFEPGTEFKVYNSFSGTLTGRLRGAGYDGVMYLRRQEVIAFDPAQIKSATGNTGAFDPADANIYHQNAPATRGYFSPDSNTITLTPNADLSTFIHELGHYFLETLTRHATELRARHDAGEALTAGQQQIIKDADTILANLGVPGLDSWHSMTIEEKRSHHELAARQFETYILEGKAPSLELQGAFQRFRAWLFRIYKAARNLNAPLNDEVRQVFDRMLATSDAIELAEQNRSMMQLFASPEEAGMTPEQYAAYQQQGRDATQAAQDEMQARALRDTQYIRNLRNKALKKKQREAKAARQQAEMQARQMVLRQPVYRVWQFLSGTMTADTTIARNKRAWTDAVDPAHDDLNTAIAKLGGLNRDAVEQEWGLDPADRIPDIRPGFPVLRRNGGLSVDGMRQALVEQGYLNDSDSLNDFYDIFSAQQRGQTQYSHQHQPDPGSGKAGEHAHLQDLPTLRLDHNALLALGYSEAQIKQLGRKVRKTGGVHPDLVAELFQDEDGNAIYDSGDAMVQALLAAKRPQDAINDVADDIMLQQFGELATPQAVALAADMAVHNDIRLRVLASEANALGKAVGNKTLLNRAARQLAQETIAAKRLRDIHPAQYTRMEARAAKAAALAQKKGDIATAAAEKRNQLLQAHLARAAYEAQEEAATHLRYLKRMSRLNPKNIDIKQREQIEAILERYNLREQSRKAIDRSQTLAQWVEEQRKQGIEVNIDPKVLDEANRTPWQHLSLTDLRGLRDSIKQIEHQGRLKNTLLLARKNRDYNATVESLVAGIEQYARRSGIENRTPTTTSGRAGAQLRRFFFAHRRTAMIAREMDGDRDGGVVWDNLIRPANERADWQTSENARATEALANILAPLIAQKGLNQKRSYTIGGKTRSFTLQDIYVMALNYGNDSNAQRLLGGENWNAAEFEQLLSQLNAEQLNSLQGVWDLFEQYRPQIAEVTRRVLGIEPEWIAPRPFTITSVDGQTVTLRGGYYPVMYDPRASAVAADQELHDMESGAYSAAVINRGFLKSRVAEVHNRPLLYNMAGIYRGLNNVIHYLAWYEWQLDSNRLLNSKRVSDAIRDHYGDDVYRQFKSWARDIAVGDLQIESEGVALVNAVRRNAGVAGLGFNIISALKQPLGLLQSVARVGGQHILPQLGRWMIHAPQMTREAKAQSEFMQNRARTRFRELNELAASLSQKNKLQTFLARHSYTMIMFVQMQVDVITWHAQQQKSLEAGASIEEANRHADQAVIDSQGSGMLKDLSAAERGQIMKLFTIYYGFMNTIMNLNYNTITSTRQGKIEKAVNLTVLLAIVPILEAALSDLLKPGDSDRWDEENAAKTMAAAMMNNLLGQFILLREFNLSGYDYSGPVGLRAIADAYKLRDEIAQGEWDKGLRRAVIGIGGSVFGLPAAQINRTLDGLQALDEGDTDNPLAVILGKPQQ